ncbi:nitrosoguanidine resistance protein SNG1 [Penicillium canescens]|nr:nitrosoguanidine resistance protein SNG1 [Penicillium canescens]KAJ6063934.1 nitrosoguanidine resistance protein SNG1 [Penicillium canescens]KAJ6154570.1 nitrosoguanidine resistance protein SNG1 [Penicillium canescens]
MFMRWVVCILIMVYAVYYRCRTALAALRMDENGASSGGELGSKLTPDATGHSFSGQSTDGMIRNRRNTAESLPLRKLASGPGYPTVGFTDSHRR